ncbi:MAG: hypothetical protein J6M62_11250 [Selenomonadaceae bacterium]|nr:hypothetical protein [Selenomonadaceae bacterium]MBO6305630.1 hypothetical protein [Selenomonadaceae bacterium]
MVYKWKYNISVEAETAGKELERMENKHGKVTPQIILDESRADNAPLHRLFEWDDTKAAEKYRLTQAQNIIHNLTITVDNPKTERQTTVRAYVKLQDEVYNYISVTKAVTEQDTYQAILNEALEEIKRFQRKYSGLVEFADICKQVKIVLDKIDKENELERVAV